MCNNRAHYIMALDSETKAPKTDQTRPDLIDQYLSAGSMFNSVDDSKVPGLKLFFFSVKLHFVNLQKSSVI